MGDRYYLQLACAWCGAMNPETRDDLMEEGIYIDSPKVHSHHIYRSERVRIYYLLHSLSLYLCLHRYAPSSGFMDFTCRKCGQKNWITQVHGAVKIEDEKELKERYKQNGFE